MPDCESGCTSLKGIFFQFHRLFYGEEDDGEDPSLEIVCFSQGCGVNPHAHVVALGGRGQTSHVMNCRGISEQGGKTSKQQPWTAAQGVC